MQDTQKRHPWQLGLGLPWPRTVLHSTTLPTPATIAALFQAAR